MFEIDGEVGEGKLPRSQGSLADSINFESSKDIGLNRDNL
jgi:hypothetical protein